MNIYDGAHIWVWQPWKIGTDEQIIEKLKALGVRGVLLKYSDGNLVGDPISQRFMAEFKRLTPKLKAAGFVVGGWTYQYLTDIDGEVDALRQAVEAGAEWIVLNGEEHVKGKNAQVAEYGRKVRAMYPDLKIGFSSYAVADLHPDVPFWEYAKYVDLMMPQMYWATIGWSVDDTFKRSFQSYSKFGKPIGPTGQAYDDPQQGIVTQVQDMARFTQLSKAAGFTHITWWDMQHFNSTHEAGIKNNTIAPPVPSPIGEIIPNWAKTAVDYVKSNGIMNGYPDGTFHPDQPVTRAELAQVAYNLLHQKK